MFMSVRPFALPDPEISGASSPVACTLAEQKCIGYLCVIDMLKLDHRHGMLSGDPNTFRAVLNGVAM